MTKGQLIEEIRVMNPTAVGTFLEQFEQEALQRYAERLRAAAEHRRRIGGWVKKDKLRAAS